MSRLRSLAALAPAFALLGARALAQSLSAASPAWVDYDGDGRIDLALLDETGSLHLYRNEVPGFREVTAEAGLARLAGLRLARWADFDRDGRADLLVASSSGALELLRSTDGVLETLDAGLGKEGVVSAEWTDVDGDGWSDLWIRAEAGWRLARNERGQRFEPAESVELPIAGLVAPSPDRSERDGVARELTAGGVPDPDASAGSLGSSTWRGSGSSSARAAAGSPPPSPPATPPRDSAPATFLAPCARTLFNEANAGCLSASSSPTLGKLYPLTTAFNVDPTGRVGIGALGPTHRLTVTSPVNDALRLIGPGATYGWGARLNFGDGNLAYVLEDVDDGLEIHANVRTALTGGPVGIGTLSPLWPLHVVGTQGVGRFDSTASTNGSVIELRNLTASPSTLGAINFVNAGGSFRGQIAYSSSDALTFRTSAAERMRIDLVGRVGIGTTAPAARLDVSEPTAVAIAATSSGTNALLAQAYTRTHAAIYARHFGTIGTTGGATGIVGETLLAGSAGVYSVGDFIATGNKFFVQPHPSDPSKEIRFVCLEGNESGTYFRGSARLAGGRAVIDVPEEFRLVSEPDGLTVQVTPRGPARAWVESVDLETVVVRGDLDVPFDYFVNGVRRGFADVELVRVNEGYVPEERGVPFGTQYPDALRRVLVENGTLNPDFTPNEATAARLGWELHDAAESRGKTGGSR